jgi:hypothetical protein
MIHIERLEERRVARRAESRLPVVVTERCEKTALRCDQELLSPLFGETVNLSEVGILVEVDEPVCLGRPVAVTIELPSGNVTLRGRVARYTRVRGTKKIRLGIELHGVDNPTRALLRAEIRRASAPAVFN